MRPLFGPYIALEWCSPERRRSLRDVAKKEPATLPLSRKDRRLTVLLGRIMKRRTCASLFYDMFLPKVPILYKFF